MREEFKGLNDLTKKELDDLLKSGTIVFDTNVLLDLYRLSNPSREDWLKTLASIKDRVFMPYRIGYEFIKNRQSVIRTEKIENENILKFIDVEFAKLETLFKSNSRIKDHVPLMMKSKNDFLSAVQKEIEAYPDFLDDDKIFESLAVVFSKKTGEDFSAQNIAEIEKLGEERFRKLIPPGFKDNNKKDPNDKFGDLILWKQILNFSKTKNKDIIFVTRDEKEDWWEIVKGQKIGPHFLLRVEFTKETNKTYYQCTPDRFMQQFKRLLDSTIKEATISETAQVSEKIIKQEVIKSNPISYEIDSDFRKVIEFMAKRRTQRNKSQTLADFINSTRVKSPLEEALDAIEIQKRNVDNSKEDDDGDGNSE